MAYGLPVKGQANYDDELNNSIEAVKSQAELAQSTADAAQTSAATAATTATNAKATADQALDFVRTTSDDRVAEHVNDTASATSAALSASYAAARVVDGLGTGADQTADIDTALTEAAAGPGRVLIRGDITTSGGHVIPEGVTVEGLGPEATKVTHTGDNVCFSMLSNDDFWMSPHIQGLTIVGNTGVSAKGIHLGNNYMAHVSDLHVQDYTAGVGIHIENTVLYTEGVQFDRVHIRTCAVGLKFSRSGTGTDSFSECRFYGLSIGMSNTNAIGILFDAGVLLYGGVLEAKIMIGPTGTGSVGIQLDPAAVVHNTRVSIYQEGATGAGIIAPTGSRWEVHGDYYSESNHSFGTKPVPGTSSITRQPVGAITAVPAITGLTPVALAPANRCVYQRFAPEAAGQKITKIGLYVGTSSGNISVAILTSPDGRNNPDNVIVSTGSIACPAGDAFAEVSLGTEVILTDNHWVALSSDNATATFGCTTGNGGMMVTNTVLGISAYQDAAHPVPSPPSPQACITPGFWLIGIP